MSVYKELGFELDEICSAQHTIRFRDGVMQGLVATSGTPGSKYDKPFVDRLRNLIKREGRFMKRTVKNDRVTWTQNCVEAVEDGVPLGFHYTITLYTVGDEKYLTVQMRSPDLPK